MEQTDTSPDVDALRDRDPQAINRLLQSKQRLIRWTLSKHDVSPQAMDDLTQEVFYQAIRSLPSFRGESKLSTWLYSIARNVACTHHEKAKRSVPWPSENVSQARAAPAEPSPEGAEDPQAATVQREHEALLQRALDQLPPHHEQVVRLRDLQEYSTREAAETLGITEVNTRVRLHRARRSLRELLAPYFRSHPDGAPTA